MRNLMSVKFRVGARGRAVFIKDKVIRVTISPLEVSTLRYSSMYRGGHEGEWLCALPCL